MGKSGSAPDPVEFKLALADGDRAGFDPSEVAAALQVLGLAPDESIEAAEKIYTEDAVGGVIFDDVLLSALASLSESCAKRVVALLGETPQETAARVSRFEVELQRRGLPRTR